MHTHTIRLVRIKRIRISLRTYFTISLFVLLQHYVLKTYSYHITMQPVSQ